MELSKSNNLDKTKKYINYNIQSYNKYILPVINKYSLKSSDSNFPTSPLSSPPDKKELLETYMSIFYKLHIDNTSKFDNNEY